MAVQAQMCPDNLALPLGFGSSLDRLMMDPLTSNNVTENSYFINSCGFNEFIVDQQFQYQPQQQHLLICPNGYINPMNLSQSLASQIEKQSLEVDRYISLQSERLRLVLQEQSKQQLATLLRKAEEKAAIFLSQKDEEISKARKRSMELKELTRKMEVESQSWQRIAAENEAMAVSLFNQLEELKEQACCLTFSNGLEDAESCCDPRNRGNEEEDEETGEICRNGEDIKKRKKMKMMMVCRVCNSRNACMLFLPCRHLCSCKACETFLDSCPVCKSAKRASIEVLVS